MPRCGLAVGAIACDLSTHVRTVTVQVDADAPPEPITFTLAGGSGESSTCVADGSVGVIRVDLDVGLGPKRYH